MRQYKFLFQIIFMLFLAVSSMVVYTGCTKKETKNSREKMESEEDMNPFEEIETDPKTEVMGSYGYTITNYDTEKRVIDDYQGGELEFDFKFNNDGVETEVGIMIYVDGIVQSLRKKGSDELVYVLPINIQEKTDTKQIIYFTPVFGAKAKEHELNFECIYMPSYRSEGRGFGNYHHALPMLTWKLNYNYQGELPAVSQKFTTEKITQRKLNTYFDVPENASLNSLNFFLMQGEEKAGSCLEFSGEDAKNANLVLMGGETCTWRLSALLNHMPAAVFDGKEYVDVEVKENEFSKVDLDFTAIRENLKDYDTFYIMITPLSLDSKFIQEKTKSAYIQLNGKEDLEDTVVDGQKKSGNEEDTVLKEETRTDQSIERILMDVIGEKRLLKIESVGEFTLMIAMRDKQEKIELAFINYETGELISRWQDQCSGSVPECVVVGDIPMLYDRTGNVFLLDKDYKIEQELKLFELLKKEDLKISSDGEKRNYCVLPEKKKILWIQQHGAFCDIYSARFDGKGKKRIKRVKGPEESLNELNTIDFLYNSADESSFYFLGCYYKSSSSHTEGKDCFGIFDLKEKQWKVYHQEKTETVRSGKNMIFYDGTTDDRTKESSGEICLLSKNGKRSITLEHKNESLSVYPTADEKYLYTCEILNEDDMETSATVRIQKYDLRTGEYIGKYISKKYPYNLIALSGQRGILYLYYNQNAQIKYQWIEVEEKEC